MVTETTTGTPTVPLSGAATVTDGAAETVTVTSLVAVPAVAVTFDVAVVVSVVRAMPPESDNAVVALS